MGGETGMEQRRDNGLPHVGGNFHEVVVIGLRHPGIKWESCFNGIAG